MDNSRPLGGVNYLWPLLKALGLLLLLPAGAIFILEQTSAFVQSDDRSECGISYGHFQANLTHWGPDRVYNVIFDGKSSAQVSWTRPNHRYLQLNFSWLGENGPGEGHIDTTTMILKSNDISVAISQSSLSALLFGETPSALNKEDRLALSYISGLIFDAAQGQLPPPRHHPYHVNKPLSGTITHFSNGLAFPYWLWWWPILWAALCIWIYVRHRRSRRPPIIP
jgi:hypothetical protein